MKTSGCIVNTKDGDIIDYSMGNGIVGALGYNDQQVTAKTIEVIKQNYTYPDALKEKLKKRLTEICPYLTFWRFYSGGGGVASLCYSLRITGQLWANEGVSGFRYPEYFESNYKNQQQRILIACPSIASGFPLYAVGWSPDLADTVAVQIPKEDETVSIGLAACLETAAIFNAEKPLSWLWERAEKFKKEFNSLDDNIKIIGDAVCGRIGAVGTSDEKSSAFIDKMLKAGVNIGPAFFYSFPHMKYDDQVLSLTKDVLGRI